MLRASATTTETDIDIQGINGDPDAAAKGVEFGAELMALGESLASGDEFTLQQAREELLAKAGGRVLVEAAGVAANFQRMVRIADSMGIPVDNMETSLGQSVREELQLNRFASAKNSLKSAD